LLCGAYRHLVFATVGHETDPDEAALRKAAFRSDHYFSEVLTELNTVFRLVPRPLTAAMIARAIPAAISPYSMAVAADSSAKNLLRMLCNYAS
jgi:hypothetical protein